jgi:hypothetical protein
MLPIVKEIKTPIQFYIGEEHVKLAEQARGFGNPNACVINQSLRSSKDVQKRGKYVLVGVHVKPNVTLLDYVRYGKEDQVLGIQVLRGRTPQMLRDATRVWDEHKPWPLPPGWYEIKPVPDTMTLVSQRKRAKQRHTEGDPHASGRAPFKARKAPAFHARYLEIRRIKKQQLGSGL